MDNIRRGSFSPPFVCVSVCFLYPISKKPMQLRSPSLTYKLSTMSPGNPFVLGSKGQRSRSRVTKTLPSWVIAIALL